MAASSLTIESPIGPVRLVAEDGAIVAVEMEGEWQDQAPLPFGRSLGPQHESPPPFALSPSTPRLRRYAQDRLRPVEGRSRSAARAPAASEPVLDTAAEQLAAWFDGRLRTFDLPLRPRGTAFQRAVWGELVRIPFGETRTYGDIATALGRPSATRAVGAANGRNPIAIVVPCHRVIGASGALTGYAGGLARKRWLLAHERAVLAR